jgi:hypothetical protein
MRSVAIDLDAASPGELVTAASTTAHELAGRPTPESAAVCLEVAEALGRTIDVAEAALTGLVRGLTGPGRCSGGGWQQLLLSTVAVATGESVE